MSWVTTSQIQIVSELRVNDVLTIISMNDVLNVIIYALAFVQARHPDFRLIPVFLDAR